MGEVVRQKHFGLRKFFQHFGALDGVVRQTQNFRKFELTPWCVGWCSALEGKLQKNFKSKFWCSRWCGAP
ncbi:hypothetical protein HAX54_050031, partial [Datura stramonium]|nr:hypothetical protein [Datura stramonium]